MQRVHRPLTVLDFFAPCLGDNARQCLHRAAMCSLLAKLVGGQARKKLYRLKGANICAAIEHSSGEIEIHCDHDRYYGLLSVRLAGADRLRVHTHERWLESA